MREVEVRTFLVPATILFTSMFFVSMVSPIPCSECGPYDTVCKESCTLAAVCGDMTCNGAETCLTCQIDCGICPSTSCSPPNCDDGNACTLDSCNRFTGQCSHTAISCADSNPCPSLVCGVSASGCGGRWPPVTGALTRYIAKEPCNDQPAGLGREHPPHPAADRQGRRFMMALL